MAHKRPIYNRVRQLDWLMWRMLSEHKCCFCGELLFEEYDPKKVNITIHHLEGDVSSDDRMKPCPIDKQLYAHCECHKAFHQMERLFNKNRDIDKKRFATMNREVKKATKLAERTKKALEK